MKRWKLIALFWLAAVVLVLPLFLINWLLGEMALRTALAFAIGLAAMGGISCTAIIVSNQHTQTETPKGD